MKNERSIYSVAILGRPNVGKSSLFNRIIGRRHSIIEKTAGTTRDRISATVSIKGKAFEITDTGGFDIDSKDNISKLVKKQIEIAVEKADLILFVCDVTEGITPLDEEILPILRKSGKEIILVVNKVDNDRLNQYVGEFFKFGLGELYPISAIQNIGVSRLIDGISKRIKPSAKTEVIEAAIRIAVVGRPNVGKSFFVNRIAKEERVIVHEEPGTTRDSIDIYLNKDGSNFIIIDTAGMRHERKIKEAVAIHSLLRARESVRRSDICVVMIDAYEGLTRDDMGILKLVEENGKGCILVVNKWDLISGFGMPQYERALIRKMDYIRGVPVLFASCKTGLNIDEVLPLVKLVYKNTKARFSKEEVKRILDNLKRGGRIPAVRSGKFAKIFDIIQEDTIPPTFHIYVSKSSYVTDGHVETIKNILRRELGLTGVPIRVRFRRKTNI